MCVHVRLMALSCISQRHEQICESCLSYGGVQASGTSGHGGFHAGTANNTVRIDQRLGKRGTQLFRCLRDLVKTK